MIESLPLLFWTARPEGGVDYLSPQWRRYLGKPDAELLGDGWLEAVHPDDREKVRNAWRHATTTRRPYSVEYRLRRQDGSWRWFRGAGIAECDSTGQVLRWIGTGTDIDEEKCVEIALRESSERFRLVLESVQIGTWDFDFRTHEFAGDDRFCVLLGTPRQKRLPYDAVLARLSSEDRERVDAELRTALAPAGNGEFDSEFRVVLPDGSQRWLAAKGRAYFAAGTPQPPLSFSGTLMEITERKRAEEAARETDRRKDEFLALLAHELRNPLAPMRNAVHLLRRIESDNPSLRRQQDVLDRQVGRMARLLDDLLDVSRMTRGQIVLRRQPLQLSRISAQAVESVQPLLSEKHHTLHYAPPSPDLIVEGDPDRLLQIIDHLLGNAAKFTPEGGEIWLEILAEGNAAVIRVRDNGIGIDAELLPHVFDLFYQASRTLDHAQGGLGIGLTLVSNLVRMHGGSVEAHSQGQGRGSEFVVRLPIYSPAAARAETAGAAPHPEHRDRVLVIEDVADTADSLAEILHLWGHVVKVVYNGEQAVDAIPRFRPDTILLDIGLPFIDGYELARRIRRSFDYHIRIIAMTGYGQPQDRDRAKEAGIREYLVKPVDPQVLKEALARPA